MFKNVVDSFLTAAFSISFHRDLLHSTSQSTGTLLQYANKYNREEASTYHLVLGLLLGGLLAWCLRLYLYYLRTCDLLLLRLTLSQASKRQAPRSRVSFVLFSDGLSALNPS